MPPLATTNEFTQLMERARAGCPEAIRELFDQYRNHVRLVVRRVLSQRLRSQYDSLDFAQSVWASFFQVPPERFTFTTPEALVAFLSQVALNKVADTARRRLGTIKHDLGREQSLSQPLGEGVALEEALPARMPSPSQLAIAEERWERLLRGAPPRYRQALEMLREGHSQREVAGVLGMHPKMLQRVLQQLRRRGDRS